MTNEIKLYTKVISAFVIFTFILFTQPSTISTRVPKYFDSSPMIVQYVVNTELIWTVSTLQSISENNQAIKSVAIVITKQKIFYEEMHKIALMTFAT